MHNNIYSIDSHSLSSLSEDNARSLSREFAWCEQVIETRLRHYAGQGDDYPAIRDITPPVHRRDDSEFAGFLCQHPLNFTERLILIMALAPAIKPRLLDPLQQSNEILNRPCTEFGCCFEDDGVFASGETLAFLLSGDALDGRFQVQHYLLNKTYSPDHHSLRDKRHPARQSDSGLHTVLQLENSLDDTLRMKAPLRVRDEYLHRFTTATPFQPELCESFPAQRVTTHLSWQDIVLPESVMAQVMEIQDWIQHGPVLLNHWGMAERIRPGYRALFYGPPGTGKTLTACLLGNATGRDVYKVDLSLIISKYIGETEKNLEKVFSLAMDKNWILFFDEADALFGKRVEAAGANDQFANQNVAYLLQRIEQFKGIIILASNLKENLDEAFNRRFESMIYFPQPGAEERRVLWQKSFSSQCRLANDVDLSHLATEYTLSGAEIMNVIRYASLRSICRDSELILKQDLQEGIRREQQKSTGTPSHREQQLAGLFG